MLYSSRSFPIFRDTIFAAISHGHARPMHYATNDVRTISRIMRATDVTVCWARCSQLTFSPRRTPMPRVLQRTVASQSAFALLSRVFTRKSLEESCSRYCRKNVEETPSYRGGYKSAPSQIHENLHGLAWHRVSAGANRFAYAIVPYVAVDM